MTMTTQSSMGGGGDPFRRYPEMPPVPKPPLYDRNLLVLDNPVMAAMRQQLSWMPDALFVIFYQAYVANGRDAELAKETMRQTPEYDVYFGGNRREDGSFRWTEAQYLGIIERFDDTLRHIAGVNPALFRHRYAELIGSNKSPEEFLSQVSSLVDRVLLDSDTMIDTYSRMWGIQATPEGLVAMALDKDINDLVLNRQITMAEIAAEGTERGFTIDKDFAASLFNKDLNEQAASDFFGAAGTWVPVLNTLAARHADPDDDFDLQDFASSEIFNDPEQRFRTRRLIAQERAGFLTPGGFGVQTSQRTGGLTGLGPR